MSYLTLAVFQPGDHPNSIRSQHAVEDLLQALQEQQIQCTNTEEFLINHLQSNEQRNELLLEHGTQAISPEVVNQLGLTLVTPAGTKPQLDNIEYYLTVLCHTVSINHLNQIAQCLNAHGLSIQTIERQDNVANRPASSDLPTHCLTLSLGGVLEHTIQLRADLRGHLRGDLRDIAQQNNIDLILQERTTREQTYRLACFDMDSTLIKAEVIDELAKHACVGEQVAAITERAMRGELDFNQSFAQRMALLEDLSESVLEQVANQLVLMDGVETLVRNLQRRGCKTAILSGGFNYFGEFLRKKLGFDFVHANALDINNGVLTGQVIEPIVNAERKARLLQEIAAQHDVPLSQTIAVGDGANDLKMLSLAGMGIAFRAKPVVQASADYALSIHGLDSILYLLGDNDHQIQRI